MSETLAPEAIADLRAALTSAVRASLPLPAPRRLGHIASCLLATADGQELPAIDGPRPRAEWAGERLPAELKTLSEEITTAVNAAKGKPGWPIRATGEQIQSAIAAVQRIMGLGGSLGESSSFSGLPPMLSSLESASFAEDPIRSSMESLSDLWALDTSGFVRTGGKIRAHRARIASKPVNLVRGASFLNALPAETLEMLNAEETRQQHIREVADQAFSKYDADGNGTIDKEELFAVLADLGQIVPRAPPPKKIGSCLDPMASGLCDCFCARALALWLLAHR